MYPYRLIYKSVLQCLGTYLFENAIMNFSFSSAMFDIRNCYIVNWCLIFMPFYFMWGKLIGCRLIATSIYPHCQKPFARWRSRAEWSKINVIASRTVCGILFAALDPPKCIYGIAAAVKFPHTLQSSVIHYCLFFSGAVSNPKIVIYLCIFLNSKM